MRRMIAFECHSDRLAGTLDEAEGTTGLLIVSGGNEVRSGAYAGQAAMAQHFGALGFPVFRFDRRGVGDSEGINGGFENSADDIAAAVGAFRTEAPHVQRVLAFGNCDAATALGLFHHDLEIDALLLANPWVIEVAGDEDPAPGAGAIRARYMARIKNPRSLIDLVTGKIDLKKLAGGLVKATQKDRPFDLAARLASALAASEVPIQILIAKRDRTAIAFMAAWRLQPFDGARETISMAECQSPSHSFADAASKEWLYQRISERMN